MSHRESELSLKTVQPYYSGRNCGLMRAGLEENVIGQDTETELKVRFRCGVEWALPHLAQTASRGWRKGTLVIMKNKHRHSLGMAYVLGIMLCYLHVFFYLVLTATLSW